MEIVILAVVIIVVAAYYGLFASIETGARMGNRAMKLLEDEQILDHTKFYANVELDADAMEKAQVARKFLDSQR